MSQSHIPVESLLIALAMHCCVENTKLPHPIPPIAYTCHTMLNTTYVVCHHWGSGFHVSEFRNAKDADDYYRTLPDGASRLILNPGGTLDKSWFYEPCWEKSLLSHLVGKHYRVSPLIFQDWRALLKRPPSKHALANHSKAASLPGKCVVCYHWGGSFQLHECTSRESALREYRRLPDGCSRFVANEEGHIMHCWYYRPEWRGFLLEHAVTHGAYISIDALSASETE